MLSRCRLLLVLALATGLTCTLQLSAQGKIVFYEDFESVPVGDSLTSNNTVTAGASTPDGTMGNSAFVTSIFPMPELDEDHIIRVLEDTGNDIFQLGSTNRYLELIDGGNRTVWATGPAPLPTGTKGFQLDFDFFDPNLPGDNRGGRLLLGDATMTSAGTSVMLSFDQGTLTAFNQGGNSKTTPYSQDTPYHVTVVGNYDTAPFEYTMDSGRIVNPGEYDVWMDGVLVIEGALFRESNGSSTHIRVASNSNGSLASINFDNIVLRDDVTLGSPTLVVDRTTGNVKLKNDTGQALNNIIGYSITSQAGALNAGEWNPVADGDSSWVKLVGEDGTDLSEASLSSPFTPVSIANNGTLDLGDVWQKYHQEDIQFDLLLDDGTATGRIFPVAVDYVGGTGGYGPFALGDLNFDGVIDALDVEQFGDHMTIPLNQTSPVASYPLGDLNGDLENDYEDLILFRTAYDAVHGAGALNLALSGTTAVPEPSSVLLLGVAIGGLALGRRRLAARPLAAAMALVACLAILPAAQADIVFQENFDAIPANDLLTTGNSAFTTRVRDLSDGHDATVLADTGNLFGNGTSNHYLRLVDGSTSSRPGLTGPANLTQTDVFELSFDFLDPTLDDKQSLRVGLTNSSEANNSKPLDFQFHGGQFSYREHDGVLDVAYEIGQKYSITAVGNFGATPIVYRNHNNEVEWVAPQTFDVWMRGAGEVFEKVSDNVPMANGAPRTTHLSVGSTGAEFGDLYLDNILLHDTIDSFTFVGAPTLTLQVNTQTGAVSIANIFDFEIDLALDYYLITGEEGSFNLGAWNSLDDQEGDEPGQGWVATGSSHSAMLQEFAIGGVSGSLASQQSLNLGEVFNTSADPQSLTFQYALNNGELITGQVEFVTGPGTLLGDFNGDGTVDAADYTVWRNNLGGDDAVLGGNGHTNGVVDAEDYVVWKTHFGTTAGAGALGLASSQVPEPASVVLLGMAACGMLYFTRRRSQMVLPAKVATLAVLVVAAIGPAQADYTIDRYYSMGDFSEGYYEGTSPSNGPQGEPVQSSLPGFDVLDADGTGGYADLIKSNPDGPIYAGVGPEGNYPRAGATGFAVEFNGTGDYLTSNSPLNIISTNGETPTITQGMQMWVYVKPDNLGVSRQVLVSDTLNSGGPAITASGLWTQNFSNHANDTQIEATVPVVPNEWHHVAQHIYLNSDTRSPTVIPGSGDAPYLYTSVVYVNGIAVSASNDASTGAGAETFLVGAEGETPGNFFSGVIDELTVYTSGPNEFNLLTDNEFIANYLPENYKEGDINFDGEVDQDDVAAFVTGWRKEKRFNSYHNDVWAGDLETLGWGDMNFDGRVDLADAFLLNQALQANGAGSLNFSLLNGVGAVPEPSSVAILLGASLAGILALRKRRA